MKEYLVVVCHDCDVVEFILADSYEVINNYLYFVKNGFYVATFSQWQFVRECTKDDSAD